LSGTIPSQISALKQLEVLSLLDNNFNGEIPSEIGELTQLKELVLSGNTLTGNVPYELMNLTSLKTLMIADNNLNQEVVSIVDENPKALQMKLHLYTTEMVASDD